jgi:hypothetical protein
MFDINHIKMPFCRNPRLEDLNRLGSTYPKISKGKIISVDYLMSIR